MKLQHFLCRKNFKVQIIIICTGIYSFFAFMTGSNNIQQANDSNILEPATTELELRMQGPLEFDDPHLVDFIKQKVLIPPSTLPYNFSTNAQYRKLRHSYGWKPIQETLKYLFSDTKNGFFVEAGALDGEFLSNSLWLEQTLNWTGLLVEPDDLNFRDMVWKRRKAWLSHSCLSNEKFPQKIVFVSTKKKKGVPIQPLEARGASFQYSYSKDLWTKYQQFYEAADNTYLKIQCFPLYTILLALNVSVIDFLSLDIQGAELDVFDTIPLDKILIRSLVIENLDNNDSNKYEFIERFNKLGFVLFSVGLGGPDYIFINKNDYLLQKKANDPRRFEFNVKHQYFIVDPFKI